MILHIFYLILMLWQSILVKTDLGNSKISCKDMKNKDVDWFVINKIPYLNNHPDERIKEGVGFWYMDATTDGQWIKPQIGIDSQNQSLAFTLGQLYRSMQQNSTFHILYNDEWPDDVGGKSKYLGHCKGSILFDQSSGFWLIHSVPRFPPKTSYEYPNSGTKFGQTALCISFHYAALQDIAAQLPFLQPSIFSSALTAKIDTEIPILRQVLKGKATVRSPYNQAKDLISYNGIKFKSFAKHKLWNKDLYFDFVAPTLLSSLFTETWQNGGGDLPSNCSSPYKVNNIDVVTLDPKILFKDSKDHSKWAITSDPDKYNVCVGDINRQRGQFKRGGGTICFRHQKAWQTYKKSINKVQDCPVKKFATGRRMMR